MKEGVEIPTTSHVVGQRYVQQADSEWRAEHCSRHHSYLTQKSHDLSDAVAFVYENSISLSSKKALVYL